MASKFTAGMKNVVEVLNQMWDAFAAGPYNALPLTGGTLTGPLTAQKATVNAGLIVAGGDISTGQKLMVAWSDTGGGSIQTYAGKALSVNVLGNNFLVGTTTDNGSDKLQVEGSAKVAITGSEGALVFHAGVRGTNSSVILYAGDGGAPSYPPSVMYVAKNSITIRGITTPGTVNTMGNDYAEYIFKSTQCGIVARGQIVGITADNTITDQWADAIMFSIKSTAPSFVGGDTWANGLGPRPQPQAGPAPTPPARRADVVERQPLPGTEPQEYQDVLTPGDTDAEWAAKKVAYAAALIAHTAAAQLDAQAMATFDAALEVERQKVDRIAIAGRVPVNVMGARPGDYIVPVQDGEGIAGIAVHADDITMPQYLRAVGRVISIEPDGRAYVMVKAV
ncbi:hypothetical protein [Janthinobacterium sp. J1-1]|uniref:hypothetical protein n=1 Tax=Janthinobacterium sp. J1-1 TaxID=3065910 RepID=UPI00281257B2|nr:hypothetical protein [Janthinobacterium sp. J1-1]